jgi:hypothetical protein
MWVRADRNQGKKYRISKLIFSPKGFLAGLFVRLLPARVFQVFRGFPDIDFVLRNAR